MNSIFEYDAQKSARNKIKHGIDFDEAQALWSTPTTQVPSRQKEQGELRFEVYGKIGQKHWTAIVHYRGRACVLSVCAGTEPKKSNTMKATPRRKQRKRKAPPPITAEELDRKFDDGEDVSEYFDFENTVVVENGLAKLELTLPMWALAGVEEEASRLGITRDALLKVWIIQRLDERRAAEAASRP